MSLKHVLNDYSLDIAIPIFDRKRDVAINSARLVESSVRHILVEGNYLFINKNSWEKVQKFFNTTVFLNVPRQTLESRLQDRWRYLGKKVIAKILKNDS